MRISYFKVIWFSQCPKSLLLTKIGICHLNKFTLTIVLRNSSFKLHFDVFFVQNHILVAILLAILNVEHANAIMLTICILVVTKKISFSVFQVVNALKYPFNAFLRKNAVLAAILNMTYENITV